MYDYQKLVMNDNFQLKMKLLDLLEERYKKDPNLFVNKSTISVELGITDEEAYKFADYLVNNKWATISEPSSSSRWRIMITDEGKKELKRIRNVIVETKKNNTNEKDDDIKLLKIDEKIKEVNLEKERRKGVAEQKFYGAVIELLDFQRDIIKQKEERNKEVIEIKNRLSKLENLFSNPQEQLIDNVYRPCYNQMIKVYDNRKFITSTPDNKWAEIEPFWKLKVEPEMKDLFEKYSQARQNFSNTWVQFANNVQSQQITMGNILARAFSHADLIKEGNSIILDERHTIHSNEWFEAFGFVILDSEISNPENLYQNLLNYANITNNGHAQWLEKWWEDNNGIYSNILDLIPELIRNFECPITKMQLDEQRNNLKKRIEELTEALVGHLE